MPIVWCGSPSSLNASKRGSVDTIVTYKQYLRLNQHPSRDWTARKKLIKWWYIVRSSGNNDNSVILFGCHAGISSLLQCLGRLSQPIAVTANSYWRDSRPRHCSRADIPAWRPKKITLLYKWRSPLHQFARARTIDKCDVTMPVSYIRVTSQINCGDITIVNQKILSLATMAKSAVDNCLVELCF